MKHIKSIVNCLLMASMSATPTFASVADDFKIPTADANGRVGALMPYVRYDSPQAALGGGASMKTSVDMAKSNIASQASDQSYIDMPGSGSYAEWTMNSTGRGVTMRFTFPDSGDGMGQKGDVDIYVNGEKVKTVTLNSYWMWQYFGGGNPSDTPGGTGCFAFDEVHFLLPKNLKEGDKIRVQSANGQDWGVDFLEIEEVPDPIEQPDNAVNVEDYGANPNDGQDDLNAFKQALAAADKGSKVLYIPEGTWNLSSIWYIFGSGVKITGAGIWYTNLQFTNSAAFGGGISGGNGSNASSAPNGGDDYCTNMEICNFYMNSSLRSRYNQNAVYKAFMDMFTGGSVIHDIWEDHFECGFWSGDYNGKMGYNDGLKIVNSRFRNNLADGVNFCQGTSNATVYNCSIRNNGDDGLACWNNNYKSAKDETGNVFAYNTIDFIWRAGGIAIYGGNNFKIYNNYLRDMFMAAGIHLNSTFDGYKFQNTSSIQFDNNILVHCGTNSDSWNEDLAAIDLKQSVKNVTFNNTQIYDSPFDAMRIMDGPTNIAFNNTKILGTGLTQADISYSCVAHTCGAIRLQNQNVKFTNTQIGGYLSDLKGNNTTFPIWIDNNAALKNSIGYQDLGNKDNCDYTVPSYPTPDNTPQGGGVTDVMEGITNYDLQVTGLSWTTDNGVVNDGQKVTFTAAVKNNSSVDIPAKAKIKLQVVMDNGAKISITYKDGLKAGETVKLTPTSSWTAAAGGRTATVTVDPDNVLDKETDEDNNTITRKINVSSTSADPTMTRVSGGADLQVLKVSFPTDNAINAGDLVLFSALIGNAGDQTVGQGQKIGVQFQIDGTTWDRGHITWCDTYYDGLKGGQTALLTANGGGSQNNAGYTDATNKYWIAQEGTHTITAWVDDDNRYSEVNENNNMLSISITIPFKPLTLWDDPDQPDDLDNPTGINKVSKVSRHAKGTYTLSGVKVNDNGMLQPGLYIRDGKGVIVK